MAASTLRWNTATAVGDGCLRAGNVYTTAAQSSTASSGSDRGAECEKSDRAAAALATASCSSISTCRPSSPMTSKRFFSALPCWSVMTSSRRSKRRRGAWKVGAKPQGQSSSRLMAGSTPFAASCPSKRRFTSREGSAPRQRSRCAGGSSSSGSKSRTVMTESALSLPPSSTQPALSKAADTMCDALRGSALPRPALLLSSAAASEKATRSSSTSTTWRCAFLSCAARCRAQSGCRYRTPAGSMASACTTISPRPTPSKLFSCGSSFARGCIVA
mmetsp:Transcript_159686/g.281918  ORF Transcript_159686/g.281918 Transcript_159686/m.281918 type:complete len:274 (-) Transcript_159686:797-1618(-)